MDENKSPEDILDEIMNRTSEPAPSPLYYPPEFDPPPEDAPLPPPEGRTPEPTGDADPAAKLLPWMFLVMGAALLVLGISVFQLVQLSGRMDELQETVEAVAEIGRLREENEALQASLQTASDQQAQAEQKSQTLKQALHDASTREAVTRIQKQRTDYLFYIGLFMEDGDYPMAALATVLSEEVYLNYYYVDSQQVPVNRAQLEQYQAYAQELTDKGYLQEVSGPEVTIPNGVCGRFADEWNPEQNPDMAALGILWCAMDGYYVENNAEKAAQYLICYQYIPLGGEGGGAYPQRVRESAREGTVGLYEQLVRDLVENGIMVEENGALAYTPDSSHTDILYGLPFNPPFYILYGDPHYGDTDADQSN